MTSSKFLHHKHLDIATWTKGVAWGKVPKWAIPHLSFVSLHSLDKERFREVKQLGYSNNEYANELGQFPFWG